MNCFSGSFASPRFRWRVGQCSLIDGSALALREEQQLLGEGLAQHLPPQPHPICSIAWAGEAIADFPAEQAQDHCGKPASSVVKAVNQTCADRNILNKRSITPPPRLWLWRKLRARAIPTYSP